MANFAPGMRLRDRYLLLDVIGVGGMARVWSARDLVLDRPVAVKELTMATRTQVGPWATGQQEARATARLSHPHITAVHDYGEVTWPEGTVSAFLVMELLRGQTLADRLAAGPLGWADAAAIGSQVADALRAAHEHGLVHQDIKPANIMLTAAGMKVLDFGIAALTSRDSGHGPIAGTPAYAPPERLHLAPPDPAGDVYSLGAVLHEMVAGGPPYPITSWDEARHHHALPADPPPLTGVPADAAAAIVSSLDRDPRRRPTAATLARLLDAHGQRFAITADDRPQGAVTPTLIASVDAPVVATAAVRQGRNHTRVYEPYAFGPEPVGGRRRPRVLAATAAVIAVAVVALLAVAVWPLLQNEGAGVPSAATTTQRLADDVPALLTILQQAVETHAADGGIDGDRLDDLRKEVSKLGQEWRPGKRDNFVGKCQELRERLLGWVADDKITPAAQQALDAVLVRLLSAAGSA